MRDEDKDGGRRLQLEKTEDDPKCAVPENIHTPPPFMEGHWKFQRGWGSRGQNFQGIGGNILKVIFFQGVQEHCQREPTKIAFVIW